MSRLVRLAALVLLVLALCGCGAKAPTGEEAERPGLPQLIQITIIPEPTATPESTATITPTALATTPTAPSTPATPAPTSEPLAIDPARVVSFDVVYGEGFPVPVTLVVQGEFGDLCSEVGRVTQARTTKGLSVGVYVVRPLAVACGAALRPFEIEVPLDITSLDVGEYEVTVNGVQGQISLKMGMVETHNPDLLCATALDDQTQARFELGDEAYCFLHPDAYEVIDTGDAVIVTARQRSDVPVPLIGEVRIYGLGLAEGLTAQQWAERVLAASLDDIPQDAWSETTFAGLPATVVVPVPGDEPTRQIFVLHEEYAYRIVFAPHLPPGAGEQGDLARALFDLVSATFVYYR